MTENGISTTGAPGQEQWEKFTSGRKQYIHYDYRHTDGELFSCVKQSLLACRAERDRWLERLYQNELEPRETRHHDCPFCGKPWREYCDEDNYPNYCPGCGEELREPDWDKITKEARV